MANQGFSKVSGFETFLPKTQEKENFLSGYGLNVQPKILTAFFFFQKR